MVFEKKPTKDKRVTKELLAVKETVKCKLSPFKATCEGGCKRVL